jgi:ornithine--oxo-acid transaminase
VLDRDDVIGNARDIGARLQARLAELLGRYDLLHDVRGRGLMIGIEFGRPSSWKLLPPWMALQAARRGLFAQTVVHALFHRHRILTQVSGDHLEVIKLIPPLTITEAEVDRFMAGFIDVMDEAHRGSGLMWDFGKTLIKQARANA